MDSTPNLALPFIIAAQAQKHVTHNEAIRALDALVQIGVTDRDLGAPPTSPADGARFIVAAGASGAWAGEDGRLAAWQDGAWSFYAPCAGWLAWVADEERLVVWDGTEWIDAAALSVNPAPLVGVNATADAANRLTVASSATLLTHAGAGHRLKIDKAAPAATASLLLQTGFSGRAEIGLTGDDDLHVKVSPDGAVWHEALHVERSTGHTVLHKLAQWFGDLLAGPVAWRWVPSSISPATPKFSMSFQDGVWNNGPAGETSYHNFVAHMGWNWIAGARENAGEAGFGLSFESKFWDGTRFGHEFHLQGEDASGNAHRWLSAFLPHDGSGGTLSTSFDTVNFRTAGNLDRVSMALAGVAPRVYFNNGVILQFNTNNSPTILQRNAAGTANIPLPYVDDFNRIAVGGGLFVNATAADAEYNAVVPINVVTLANNKAILYGQMSNMLSGNCFAFDFFNLNASGKVTGGVGNATGHAVIEARTEVAAGDPILSVQINGETGYSIGIDNSDGNKFKISAGIQRLGHGNEDRLVIDDDRAEWKLPVKLPSYTVAGLPSASSAGAGALCFVSNASGGPTLACSDGSSWRVAGVLGGTVS